MTKEELERKVEVFVNASPMNYVSEEEALAPDCIGLKMYEPPIWGYGTADDKMFARISEERSSRSAVSLAGTMAWRSKKCY